MMEFFYTLTAIERYEQQHPDHFWYGFEAAKLLPEDVTHKDRLIFIHTAAVYGTRKYACSFTLDNDTGTYGDWRDNIPDRLKPWDEASLASHLVKETISKLYRLVEKGSIPWLEAKPETSRELQNVLYQGEAAVKAELTEEARRAASGKGTVRFVVDFSLSETGNALYASFSVGRERLYRVRGVETFRSYCRTQETRTYGKSLTWNHNLYDLDDYDRAMFDLFKDAPMAPDKWGYGQTNSSFVEVDAATLRAALNLTLAQKRPLYVNGKAYTLQEGEPALHAAITQPNEKTWRLLISVDKEVQPLSLYHEYLFTRGTVASVASDATARWMDRYHICALIGKPQTISRDDLPRFCQIILPVLEPYMEVDGKDCLPQDIIPPAGKVRFRMDLSEWDALTITPSVRYGTKSVNWFEPSGKTPDVRRNAYEEQRIRTMVEARLPSYRAYGKNYEIETKSDEELIDDYLYVKKMLSGFGTVTTGRTLDEHITFNNPPVAIDLSLNGGLLSVDFDVDHDFLAEIPAILKAYKEKKRYYRLASGNLVSLGDKALASLAALSDDLGVSAADLAKGSFKLPAYRALYLDGMRKSDDGVTYTRDAAFNQEVREILHYEGSSLPVPKAITATLREYQETGFHWLTTLSQHGMGGILADDMGLGKTLETLALFAWAKETAGHLDALVVAPASLVYAWRDEAEKFCPSLSVVAVTGTAAARKELWDRQADLHVTSYDLARRDLSVCGARTWDYLVLDEAQYIRNAGTLASRAVKHIAATHRFALSGTPVENHLLDLWSIFDFLMPGFLFGKTQFTRLFETPAKRGDTQRLAVLGRLVAPFVLRRMKKDVLGELPEREIITRHVSLEGKQEDLYKANLVASQAEFHTLLASKGLKESHIEALSMLTRLRLLCDDPALVYESYKETSAKRETCKELVRSALEGGHRILLFSQFTKMLDILAQDLAASDVAFFRLDGSTSKEQRHDLVERFQQGEGQVFLISLKAGGLGLNLTGADTVILYDPWWNLASEGQAMDRTYRIGQTRNVTVYRLIAENTVEEKILKIQEHKQQLGEEVIGASWSELTEDEWRELFS